MYRMRIPVQPFSQLSHPGLQARTQLKEFKSPVRACCPCIGAVRTHSPYGTSSFTFSGCHSDSSLPTCLPPEPSSSATTPLWDSRVSIPALAPRTPSVMSFLEPRSPGSPRLPMCLPQVITGPLHSHHASAPSSHWFHSACSFGVSRLSPAAVPGKSLLVSLGQRVSKGCSSLPAPATQTSRSTPESPTLAGPPCPTSPRALEKGWPHEDAVQLPSSTPKL